MEDSTNCKESSSLYTGYSTKQYPLSKDIVETPKLTKFLKEGQKFYVKTFSYLLKSMPVLCDPTLKCVSVFFTPAEKADIKDHLTLLTPQFLLVVSKENARLSNRKRKRAAEKMMKITNAEELINTGSKYR